VGEKAITTTEKYLQGKRRSGGGNQRTSTQSAGDLEAADEDEDEDEG